MSDFDPYYEWLGIPPKDQPPNLYRLLGIEAFEADEKVIELAAEQRVAHLRTRSMGKHAELSQRLLNEVVSARGVLLVPETKAAYDAELHRAIGPKPLPVAGPLPAVSPPVIPMAIPSAPPVHAHAPPVVHGNAPPASPASAPPRVGGPVVKPKHGAHPADPPPWQNPLVIGGLIAAAALVGGLILFMTQSSTPHVAGNPRPKSPETRPGDRKPRPLPGPEIKDPFVPAETPKPSDPPPMKPVEMTPPVTPSPAPPTDPSKPPVDPAPADPKPADPAPADPAANAPKRIAVPDAKARTDATNYVRPFFQAEMAAARTADQKREVAVKLLKAATEEKPGPNHYAALQLAREMAIGGLDYDLILEICQKLANTYDLDGERVFAETLAAALEAPGPAPAKRPMAQAVLVVVDQLLMKDEFTVAGEVIKSLTESARAIKDKEFIQLVADRRKLGAELFALHKDVQPALETLKTKPDDPEANATAGRYLALVKNDFERGLPMLARSSDAQLAPLAKADLAQPADAHEQVKIADQWYDLAADGHATEKLFGRLRAAMWYRKAVGSLTGLEHARVTQRIAELPEPPDPKRAAAAAPVAAAPKAPFRVKLLAASWGSASQRADITAKLRAYLEADPYGPIAADNRMMGDPAPGQKKHLEITAEVDGIPVSITRPENEQSTPPLVLPAAAEQGVAVPSASQEFRVLAARYGAGVSWSDITLPVQQRVEHPGQKMVWGGFTWNDPWFGVQKSIVIWFDYKGKRYARVFRDNDNKQLIDGEPAPKAIAGTFVGTIAKGEWVNSKPDQPKLGASKTTFGLVTELAGKLDGYGQEARMKQEADQWQLSGLGSQPLSLHGIALTADLRDKFQAKPEEFEWHAGGKPVKMISSAEGFCVLAGVSGKFAGVTDQVLVSLDRDGYWYLGGLAASGEVRGRALAYRLKPGVAVKLHYMEFVSMGPGYRMLAKNEGFCFLSGVAGNFQGVVEQAKVILHDRGEWELTAARCWSRAYAVRVE